MASRVLFYCLLKSSISVLKTSTPFSFKVHSLVLAAASDFFHNILLKNITIFILDCVESVTLKKIVRFFYLGEIRLTAANIEPVIEAAHELKIESLKVICSEFLEKSLDDGNCLRYALLAEKCGLKSSKELAQKFLATNCTRICKLKVFHSWSESQFDDVVKQLLKNDELYENLIKQMESNGHSATMLQLLSNDLFQAIFRSFVSSFSFLNVSRQLNE